MPPASSNSNVQSGDGRQQGILGKSQHLFNQTGHFRRSDLYKKVLLLEKSPEVARIQPLQFRGAVRVQPILPGATIPGMGYIVIIY